MRDVASAFPEALRVDAGVVDRVIPASPFEMDGRFVVRVEGEAVSVPVRIYSDEPAPSVMQTLTPVQRTMLACWYTRHHDGFVRQRFVRRVVAEQHLWVAPFVVQLLGEYVVEIVMDIREALAGFAAPTSPLHEGYARFARENPEYVRLVGQRAASYWDCYYRGRFTRQSYPAFHVLDDLRAATARPAM